CAQPKAALRTLERPITRSHCATFWLWRRVRSRCWRAMPPQPNITSECCKTIRQDMHWCAGAPGVAGAASDHFRGTLDWARWQGALSGELRTATSLARLWCQHAEAEEVKKFLSLVYGRFDEGFKTPARPVCTTRRSHKGAATGELSSCLKRRESGN